MNFIQLYGIPWRHLEVADETQNNVVDQAMVTMGSQGFLRTARPMATAAGSRGNPPR